MHENEFIEEMGLFFEHLEMPRTAGRIMGRLLICDPPHQSMNDLAKKLQASKGSISTASRVLLNSAVVERVKFAKDRQDYFRITSGAWTHHFKGQNQIITSLRELAEKGMTVLKGEPKKRKERLFEMFHFYKWLEKEIPLLIKRWEKEQASR